MQITNAFSNEPSDRQYQDVGFDGLGDEDEKSKFATYLNNLQATAPGAYQQALTDPSADNFRPYRDAAYDAAGAGILRRYKDINNPNGNSPIANTNSDFVNAFTQYPDAEELNRDNTLNEVEEYFQYKVDIVPFMTAGSNFITGRTKRQC
jgi:cell surface protein SprA